MTTTAQTQRGSSSWSRGSLPLNGTTDAATDPSVATDSATGAPRSRLGGRLSLLRARPAHVPLSLESPLQTTHTASVSTSPILLFTTSATDDGRTGEAAVVGVHLLPQKVKQNEHCRRRTQRQPSQFAPIPLSSLTHHTDTYLPRTTGRTRQSRQRAASSPLAPAQCGRQTSKRAARPCT